MYKFFFTEYAVRQLGTLPRFVQKRIKEKLLFWQQQENPLVFARSLIGFSPATHRFRIGDYRLICSVEKRQFVILVLKVGHRKDVYR